MERHDVVVVGAGPAGLAVAAALSERGTPPLVLERGGGVASAWRHHRYDRLHLHTVRWLSGLPGYRIPRSCGRWVSRDAFLDYLERYAERHRIRPRLGVAVERIERRDGGWRLATSAEAITARAVVVATGSSNEPYLPPWPGRAAYGRTLVHSAAYRTPEPYRGKDVLVVGSGNSGSEIAVDLAEGGAARVRIAVRTPPVIVRRDRFGLPSQLLGIAISPLPSAVSNPLARTLRRLTLPDLSAYGLPAPARPFDQFERTRTIPLLDVGFVDAVVRGNVEVVAAVERFDGDEVVLVDGRRISPEAVVAATGFRPGLEPLVGHLGVLDGRGLPLVRGAETHPAAPGLRFVGIGVALGGLLREVARDARAAARAVETELREPVTDAPAAVSD